MSSGQHFGLSINHRYLVECWRDGALVWEDAFCNLVTFRGLEKYLDGVLKSGLSSPAWYLGLIVGPGENNTYDQADEAGDHRGWLEGTAYAEPTRPPWVPGELSRGVSPACISNSACRAAFRIDKSATIAGCFMIDDATKGGSVGTLLGEGNFSGGDRSVHSGDILYVTVTASMS